MAQSNTLMNDTGPGVLPHVDTSGSSAGRRREKEYPVPPPDCWIRAASFTVSKMRPGSSSTGWTKHALSWPPLTPAFISVGEFGRKSRLESSSKKASSHSTTAPGPP